MNQYWYLRIQQNYTTENTIYFPLLRQAIFKYLGNTINNNFATSWLYSEANFKWRNKGKANKMDNFCQSPKKHLIKIYTPTWHARGFLHRTTYPCPKLTLIRCIWNNRKSTWLSNPLTSSRLTSWAGMLFKVIKSNKKGGNEMLGRDLDNLPLSPALCSGLKQKG